MVGDMEEYLALQEDGSYKLVMRGKNCSSTDIKVPEGAEEYRSNGIFYKDNGEFFCCPYNGWSKSFYSTDYSTVWKRNTATQEKLKFIEKWLNGEKIQYSLEVESDKSKEDESKWHNFTEGAMQYIKRSDIKFREAPKYVTIDGIKFKNFESILNYINSNFDLEDGE